MKIDLVDTLETGGAPPVYRPPERIAADSFVLALKDIAQGQIVHTQRVDDYEDQTRLRRIVTDGKREVEFEFTDQGNKQGDYYFVRVVQANDAIAWSSPVWIGGHNKQ